MPPYLGHIAQTMDKATATGNVAAQNQIAKSWALNSLFFGIPGLIQAGSEFANGNPDPALECAGNMIFFRQLDRVLARPGVALAKGRSHSLGVVAANIRQVEQDRRRRLGPQGPPSGCGRQGGDR